MRSSGYKIVHMSRLLLVAALLAPALLPAADEPFTLPLWANGAPGSEGQTSAEVIKDLSANGVTTRQVSNIHNSCRSAPSTSSPNLTTSPHACPRSPAN